MHLSPILSLLLILPLSAASTPPLHQLRFSKNLLLYSSAAAAAASPQEYIEVTRPLRFDSLVPSCTLPILSHSFANTIDLPPVNITYSPPLDCKWSNAVLQLSATSNGSQYDRIAAVWLAGVELLRTSTPQPTSDEIFWNFRKDVTRYAALLRQSDLNLFVMLENIVSDVYTGIYRVNLTFHYYDIPSNCTANLLYRPVQKSTIRKLKDNFVSLSLNESLELDQNPADSVIPISASGDEGFWFKIQSELDAVYHGIQIPSNTYRAVIEVYVSSHGNDEFWYSNPPDYYLEINNLTTSRGHGAYREVLVKLDNNVIGSVIPFPVIYPGGINPLFWEPVVSIGAFDLPSYEIEITPLLGILLDGKVHYFGLGVADAIPYWLVDANLHLWLDDKADEVQAGPIKYSDDDSSVELEFKFQQLDGKFEVEAERKSEFSGWVSSSAGNFTTYVTNKVEFENTVEFKKNATRKSVEQEVKVTNKVEIKSSEGKEVAKFSVERKYPLKIKTEILPGAGQDNDLMFTKLEHSYKEEKKMGKFTSKLENTQKSEGWKFVQDHDVLSGDGNTEQDYYVKDNSGCYRRKISTEYGVISTDTKNFVCAIAAADA